MYFIVLELSTIKVQKTISKFYRDNNHFYNSAPSPFSSVDSCTTRSDVCGAAVHTHSHCRIKTTPIGEVQRFSALNCQLFQKSFTISTEKSPIMFNLCQMKVCTEQ